jgi:hypothetical protein
MYGFPYFLNELRVGHSGNTSLATYICRDTLKCHYRYRPGLFRYSSLLCINDIHDYATL